MLDTIFKHRTIRNYKSLAVDDKLLNEILLAGSRASTTGNMQVYSIIVTKDKEIKEKLWQAHFKQEMVKQAPVILTFCADFNRFNKWCEQRQANPGYDNFLSFYTASIDALLAAQNVALASEAHGLGICYLGTTTYMAADIIKILNLPKAVVPVTSIVIGYPEEIPELTDRLPLEAIVHYESYKDYSNADIDRIYKDKEALQQTKDLLVENRKETLAQVFTDNRYTRKDNVHFSKEYLSIIKQQGFMNNE